MWSMCQLVSIIVPVYNIEKRIKKCLETISNQSYSNIEIIVIDDGSTDGSGAIIDELSQSDNRMIIVHQANGGLSKARNKGIDISSGSLLMFVDGDDYLPTNSVELLINRMKYDKSEIIIGTYFLDATEVQKVNIRHNGVYSSNESINIGLRGEVSAAAWAKLYKKDLFGNEIRYPVGRRYEDTIVFFKLLAKAKRISIYNDSVYFYVQDKNSITHNYKKSDIDDILLNADELKKNLGGNIAVENSMNMYLCDMMIYLLRINIVLNESYRLNDIEHEIKKAVSVLDTIDLIFDPRCYKYLLIKLGLIKKVLKWKIKKSVF